MIFVVYLLIFDIITSFCRATSQGCAVALFLCAKMPILQNKDYKFLQN